MDEHQALDPSVAILIQAAAIVRRGWCRGAPARNSAGHPVRTRSASAVYFCMVGAIHRAAWELFGGDAASQTLEESFTDVRWYAECFKSVSARLRIRHGCRSLSWFNDAVVSGEEVARELEIISGELAADLASRKERIIP